MDLKKTSITTLAAFLPMFMLSAIWNMIIVRNFVTESVSIAKAHPDIHFVAIGYLMLSVIMSTLYPKLKGSGRPHIEGLKFGALMGIIWILPINIVLHGVYDLPSMSLIMDPVWAIIEQSIGGLALSLVYQKLE